MSSPPSNDSHISSLQFLLSQSRCYLRHAFIMHFVVAMKHTLLTFFFFSLSLYNYLRYRRLRRTYIVYYRGRTVREKDAVFKTKVSK